jgi:deazaflavin-dependent oxidoreductase (nitroreductase family)
MPMPLWWGQVNKRIFNPRAIRNGKWAVIDHVGRVSGRLHRTPLDAYEIDGTFIFILVYGSKSDWVQNILASGHASLVIRGEKVELGAPRVIPETIAWPLLDGLAEPPPAFLNVNEFLQMDILRRTTVGSEPSEGDRVM